MRPSIRLNNAAQQKSAEPNFESTRLILLQPCLSPSRRTTLPCTLYQRAVAQSLLRNPQSASVRETRRLPTHTVSSGTHWRAAGAS
jgi:hypothetical protein